MATPKPEHLVGLHRVADRILVVGSGCGILVLSLVTLLGVLRPAGGGNYGILTACVLVALLSSLLFLLFRRRLYRHMDPRKLALLMVSTALPIVGIEIYANFTNLNGYLYFAESEEYFQWLRYEGVVTSYAHPTNATLTFPWGRVQTNSEGWRSPEVDLKAPPKTLRVLGLGDSVVLGGGVDQEFMLCQQFEDALRKSLSDLQGYGRVEVLNTGHSSFDSIDELLMLKNRGLAYQPDAVFLIVLQNDFNMRPPVTDQVAWLEQAGVLEPALLDAMRAKCRSRRELFGQRRGLLAAIYDKINYWAMRSYCAQAAALLVRRVHSANSAQNPGATSLPPSDEALEKNYPQLLANGLALREIALTCQAKHLPLMIFYFNLEDALASYLGHRVKEICPLIKLDPAGVDTRSLRLSQSDAHWNREGSRIYASLMAKSLLEMLQQR